MMFLAQHLLSILIWLPIGAGVALLVIGDDGDVRSERAKLMRYSAALNMLITTIRENSRALLASFLILLTVMLLAASGIYHFERQAQPVAFGSIPAAMWWAFSTLSMRFLASPAWPVPQSDGGTARTSR